MKIKKEKIQTVGFWKKKLWTIFSLWIRTKDAKKGYNYCVTCGKLYSIKKLQAGHFIPGRHNAVLFCEDLVHPQCYSCNIFLRGNPRAYDKYMREKYGDEKVMKFDELGKSHSSSLRQYSIPELKQLYEYYKEKLANLSVDNL